MKHDHYYIFENAVNLDNVRLFADWLENRPDGKILFSITSAGGVVTAGRLLLKILNENKDRITLHILGGVYSIAFIVVYEYEGTISLTLNESKGMIHYGYQSLNTDERGVVVYKEDRICLENLKLQRKQSDLQVEEFMTLVELRKFKKGEDVYFNFKRMSEIFPKALMV